MGYPYGKTYLEQIQENHQECEEIKQAFYVLRQKYARDHKIGDSIELTIKQNFEVLGEAFELASETVGNITDAHHFLWDVVDELLTPKDKKEDE